MAKSKPTPAGVKTQTVIKRCKCTHVDQDKKNGKGLRLHNRTQKGYRCCVCGNDK